MLHCCMAHNPANDHSSSQQSNQTGNHSNQVMDIANAEHYIWGEGCDGWHLLKQPDMSVIYDRVPAGGHEVRHYHERARQFFFVLAGEAVLEVDGVTHHLGYQQGLAVNPQQPHQLRNESQADLVFLVISAPATQACFGQSKDRVQF